MNSSEKSEEANVILEDENMEDYIGQEREEKVRDLKRNIFATLFDNIPDFIYFKDREGKYIKVSKSLADLFGIDSTDIIGKKDIDFYVKSQAEESSEEDMHIVETGIPIIDKEEFVHILNGGKRWFSITKLPWFNEQRNIIGVFGVSRDITENKRLGAQIFYSQTLESVGRLSRGIAHEFNNLLTVIKGNVRLLARSDDIMNLELELSHIEAIGKAANTAATLVEKLTAFGQKKELHPEVIDLNRSLEGLKNMLRSAVREDIEIVGNCCDEEALIEVDPLLIERVMLDLAMNAAETMDEGGTITFSTETLELRERYISSGGPFIDPGYYVVLEVSDTSAGMLPEELVHVFEPNLKSIEVGKGSGFVIPGIFGIIKQSGGEMSAYSEKGLGSTFRIYLPRKGQFGKVHTRDVEKAFLTGKGETVLLVEDEEEVRTLIATILDNHGYRVIQASNGREAIEIARPEKIDLLITDVIMPEMGGPELVGSLTLSQPGVKVLYMSGYPAGHDRIKNGLFASSAFMKKPFTPGDLITEVRNLLGQE